MPLLGQAAPSAAGVRPRPQAAAAASSKRLGGAARMPHLIKGGQGHNDGAQGEAGGADAGDQAHFAQLLAPAPRPDGEPAHPQVVRHLSGTVQGSPEWARHQAGPAGRCHRQAGHSQVGSAHAVLGCPPQRPSSALLLLKARQGSSWCLLLIDLRCGKLGAASGLHGAVATPRASLHRVRLDRTGSPNSHSARLDGSTKASTAGKKKKKNFIAQHVTG